MKSLSLRIDVSTQSSMLASPLLPSWHIFLCPLLDLKFFPCPLQEWFRVITIIITIIWLFWVFFAPSLADGFSLEFEWQQVSSSLLDSSQYSWPISIMLYCSMDERERERERESVCVWERERERERKREGERETRKMTGLSVRSENVWATEIDR